MIPTEEMPVEDEMLPVREERLSIQLARIEQRLTDHESHDTHFRQIMVWATGIFIAVLVTIIGAMVGDINRIDGRQQVVLSTVNDIKEQLYDIKEETRLIRQEFKESREKAK